MAVFEVFLDFLAQPVYISAKLIEHLRNRYSTGAEACIGVQNFFSELAGWDLTISMDLVRRLRKSKFWGKKSGVPFEISQKYRI